MTDCIFCKITNGDIPSERVYEDENVVAFLDVTPAIDGHVLIVPKKHYINMFDVPEDILEDISKGIREVSAMMKENFKADGINVMNNSGEVAGQKVFHIHFHIFPRFDGDERALHLDGEKKLNPDIKEIAKRIRGE